MNSQYTWYRVIVNVFWAFRSDDQYVQKNINWVKVHFFRAFFIMHHSVFANCLNFSLCTRPLAFLEGRSIISVIHPSVCGLKWRLACPRQVVKALFYWCGTGECNAWCSSWRRGQQHLGSAPPVKRYIWCQHTKSAGTNYPASVNYGYEGNFLLETYAMFGYLCPSNCQKHLCNAKWTV